MDRRYFLTTATLASALLLSPAALRASQGTTQISLVETFHRALLSSMKSAATTSVKQRFDHLAPVIADSFHAGLMIQVASGSYWRKASDAQHDRLISAFADLSVATYAAQFNGYSGQSFETIGDKPGPQKTVLIETRIVDPESDPVALTYVTRKIKGQWRIIDVLLDSGISELARKRSEYRGVLKASGVDGLIEMLKMKTASLLGN